MQAPKKYFVVSGTYNAEAYIGKCIQSVNEQITDDFEIHHIIIDDGSTDKTADEIKKYSGPRQIVITHEKNLGPIQSQLDGFAKARELGTDYDVIAQLDGDDWFSTKAAVSTVHYVYRDTGAGATYGNYVDDRGIPSCCRVPDWSNLRRDLKKNGWPFSHLRTFRVGYTKHLEDKHLRDDNGEYFTAAPDVVICLPIFEMAGSSSVVFIQKNLVVYNGTNPLHEASLRYFEQASCAQDSYNKPLRTAVVL